MFEFFEKLIGKVGVKLVSDFTEKLIDFIKNTEKIIIVNTEHK